MRIVSLLFGFSLFLWADSWSVVISKSCGKITPNVLQHIYLKKIRFIGECRLVPLNLGSQSSVRAKMMKNILHIKNREWKDYYNELHFKGIDPPKTLSSKEAMFQYLVRIKGAVGYIPSKFVSETFYTIVEFNP